MKKNFSTYPKETGADQSSVRRLSLVDRRYVFSISVSLSAKEMNKSAAFCLLSPWGQTQNRLQAPLLYSKLGKCQVRMLVSSCKQSRINKKM